MVSGMFSSAAIFALLAMFLFSLRDIMAWAFVERIGAGVGYSSEEVGSLLSLQALVGIVGPLAASVIGARMGLRIPVIIGVVLSGGVTVSILASTHSAELYALSVSFISISYFYALAYLTTLAATIDKAGRVVAASGGFLIAGSALAPMVSGIVIDMGGYQMLSYVAVAVVVLTLISALLSLHFSQKNEFFG